MAGHDREFEMLSVGRQVRAMGAKKADDLISTMMDDHEQAQRFGTIRRRHASHAPRDGPATTTSLPATMRPPRSTSLPSPPSAHAPEPADRPTTSLMPRTMRSRSAIEDVAHPPPPVNSTIKQSHWKPMATASKCAAPTCRKLFSTSSVLRNRRRNCAMCGLVFCRNCTNYTRKLSANAHPDPLGRFHSVCQACFNFHNKFGGERDHMREFRTIRQHRLDLINGNERVQGALSLCSRRSTEGKQAFMRREVNRLVEGYRANPSRIRELVGDMVIPDWQKSSNWVASKDAAKCLNCGTDFGILKRKLHCRIGGQVFCTNCATDELILYVDDTGEVRWALNGKDGGPTKVPEKYRLLVICHNCSTELQDMMVLQANATPPSVFLESLSSLQVQLSRLQQKIESNLPNYKQLVESMDAEDCSPNHVAGRHPMRKLIKAHTDLSDAFSSLAVDSQQLRLLKPKSHLQEKLLRNVMMGMYRSYSDNMYTFRNLKNHLADFVPIETLAIIQELLSQQSMERIHVLVQQLIFEALHLEHQYKFDNSFFTPIIAISNEMDVEFKEFLEAKGESWEVHEKVVKKFVEEEMKNNRHRIKIDSAVLKHRQPRVIHYLVVSQCSSFIHECFRELQAKTVDREFRKVKESLHNACEKLDTILVTLNAASV